MKNCTQGFIISIFLLVQTVAKLRNLQIYENCQLWYSLNYSNFLQVIVLISKKVIIRKIFPKYMGLITSTRLLKKCLYQMLLSFSKMKMLLSQQYQVIHPYKNLYCSTYVYLYYTIICIFMYIKLWCIITVFQISCKA